MDFGAALSVAQTLFAALQSTQLREVWSIWDYQSELDRLTTTVKTIKSVLLDAEAKQDQLSHEARHYVEETCSYVNHTEIIGRDEDVDKIVAKLFNSDNQADVSFLTIVGMGGLGKTALAQLIYNDHRIAEQFPLKIWTCVSDQDQNQFDVQTILGQILESSTGQDHDGHSMEVLQRRLRELITGKKFLLVLDDVWTEDRVEWSKLVRYFTGGQSGSWVVVTSRSKQTANIVGSTSMYELQGLSNENSWRLFQLTAFEDDAHLQEKHEFVRIGQEIVTKCANVPLAIRVMGSLLYGQEKKKWLSVKEVGVTNLRESQNGIKDVLKLSYHNLETSLKSCFSYCALFRKDSRMRKEQLTSLWMAQGYVAPLEKGQSLEDAAEEYFLILVRRCFLQDLEKTDWGEIESCKMHDFMHDIALEVSEKEIRAGKSFVDNLDSKVRHVSIWGNQYPNSFTKAHIRSHLHLSYSTQNMDGRLGSMVASYKRLRSLDLSHLQFKCLPESIGKLLHLRYLNLSWNGYLKLLPKSITKLYNLQVLDLSWCVSLEELPKDLSKLLNLRILNLWDCSALSSMPLGMDKLTSLHKLNQYVVAKGNPMKQRVALESLRALKNLRGSIEIKIHFLESSACTNDGNKSEAAYLSKLEHVNTIYFYCKHEESDEGASVYEEELLGDLQPHSNLKQLKLYYYRGETMPRWATGDNLAASLPALVRLTVKGCRGLQSLPSLSKLQCLKSLNIVDLPNVEYIEEMTVTLEEGLTPFSSLEELKLKKMPKLKGWWRRPIMDDDSDDYSWCSEESPSVSFPQLRSLRIEGCSELTYIPWCPNLKEIGLFGFNETLRIIVAAQGRCEKNRTASLYCPKLKEVSIDNVAWLHSALPMEAFQGLIYLHLHGDMETESVSQLLRACSSSLKRLSISDSPELRSVFREFKCLSNLTGLSLSKLQKDCLVHEENEGEDEEAGMPWGSLHHTLQSLSIYDCKELTFFPKWMRNLSSLQLLDVGGCSESLYQRCQKPNGEDWPNIQHIPNVFIRRQ